MTDEKFILIGKLGAAFGVHGWIKVHTYTELGASILDYDPWYLSNNDSNYHAVSFDEGKEHHGGVIVKFSGYDNPESVRKLTGKSIHIKRSQLPELNTEEYYWSDLVGMTVIDQHGNILGKVIYLIETGANDVLVVKGDKEIAIPYLPGSVVLNIDAEKQIILVDWEPI
jgi:16S rRNA processing protein RimM